MLLARKMVTLPLVPSPWLGPSAVFLKMMSVQSSSSSLVRRPSEA